MSHNHSHSNLKGKKLILSIILNIGITLSQIYGSIVSGSLSLLSDALHNFSDVLALIITYIGNKLTQSKFSKTKTFGLKRAEILAALINTTMLIAISFILIKESIFRFQNIQSIDSTWVISLSILSILFNGISVLLLHKDSHDNLNIKSAYLHLLTDMFSSFAILLGGLGMYYFQIFWLDPLLTIIIGIYLMISGVQLFFETIRVLMQFSPSDIDIEKVQNEIKKIEYIENIHHVHLWKLNENDIYFEAHVDINKDILLSEVDNILKMVRDTLNKKFKISHTTLQPEFAIDDSKSLISDHHH